MKFSRLRIVFQCLCLALKTCISYAMEEEDDLKNVASVLEELKLLVSNGVAFDII